MSIDGAKDLVTIKGTMEVKSLQLHLKEKLRRDVEIVPAKKEEKKDEKKVEKNEAKKEDKKNDLVVEAPKIDMNKMQYYGSYPAGGSSSSYWFENGQMSYDHNYSGGYYGYNSPTLPSPVPVQGQNMGFFTQNGVEQMYHVQPASYGYNIHAPPQMFSDENPNACSVM